MRPYLTRMGQEFSLLSIALMRIFPKAIVVTIKSCIDAYVFLFKVRLGGEDNSVTENPHKFF